MLGEDNELFAAAIRRAEQGVVLQKGGKFVPLAILPAPTHGVGHGFKAAQRSDLRLQFGNGGGGGGLVGHGLLLPFQFAGGQVVKIVQIVRQVKGSCAVRRATALRFLRKARFQPLAPAAQGLIDGLRRGGEAALEDGQREAHGSAAVAGKGVRAVELLLHIIRHGGVKLRLHGRKVVVDRVGQALGKSGVPSNLSRSSFTRRRMTSETSMVWLPVRQTPSKRSGSTSAMKSWKSASLPLCGVAVSKRKWRARPESRQPSW